MEQSEARIDDGDVSLVRTGALAKLLGGDMTPSKINYYRKLGLLFPSRVHRNRMLWDVGAVRQRLKTIQHMQTKERLTLEEIAERLRGNRIER